MVAIVSGGGLGLIGGSMYALGGQQGAVGNAAFGRNGNQVYVNAASGNLVVQNRDEFLASRGFDTALTRTYNSQGAFTDKLGFYIDGDNGDNFRFGSYKKVAGAGKLNAPGGTVTRTDGDGTTSVYNYDVARGLYVSTSGDGAFDTISFSAANGSNPQTWIWTDGSTQATEIYNATGLITSATDTDGNTSTYTYNGRLLLSVTSSSGDVLRFDYAGNNLSQIRTISQGVTQTSTRYTYDSSNRLASVTVDLSPDDNTVADGNVYTTSYTYDGTSRRIATITQTDGSVLAFTYLQVGSDFKIASMSDAQGRVTRFAYDTVNRRTDMTDPLGYVTTFGYDANSQLTEVLSPAVNGVRVRTSYAYDASGNVTQVTDGSGNAVTMQYDGRGNQTLQQDALGNTVARTYSTTNLKLTESIRMGAGAPLVSRYAYDSRGHLRFAVSASGRVTEFQYDAKGQKTAQISYTGAQFDLAAFAENATVTEAALAAWVTAHDRSQAERTDFTYDFRGQLASSTTYAALDTSGKGVLDGSASTRFVYDQEGRLLKSIDPRGASMVTSYSYDGLDRLLSSTDALGQQTLTQYDDAHNKTVTTQANGLASTATYDASGELTSVIQSNQNGGSVLGAAR
ncbi:hypothetical protein, partial [Massilia antarctica]